MSTRADDTSVNAALLAAALEEVTPLPTVPVLASAGSGSGSTVPLSQAVRVFPLSDRVAAPDHDSIDYTDLYDAAAFAVGRLRALPASAHNHVVADRFDMVLRALGGRLHYAQVPDLDAGKQQVKALVRGLERIAAALGLVVTVFSRKAKPPTTSDRVYRLGHYRMTWSGLLAIRSAWPTASGQAPTESMAGGPAAAASLGWFVLQYYIAGPSSYGLCVSFGYITGSVAATVSFSALASPQASYQPQDEDITALANRIGALGIV